MNRVCVAGDEPGILLIVLMLMAMSIYTVYIYNV